MKRSIKHYYKGICNPGKISGIAEIREQLTKACQFYIDYVYSHSFEDFDISKDILNYPPKYIDYQLANDFAKENDLKLSARALSSAMTQALGVVKGSIAKRRKLQYIIKKRKEAGLITDFFEEQLEKYSIVKPTLSEDFNPEISSKLVDFQNDSKYFDSFLRIKSTGFEHIKIPIKYSKADKKWINKNGKQINSVILSKNYVCIRYEVPDVEKKSSGKVVGADTGLISVTTLSDGQVSKPDHHGHTLNSICQKMARQQKDSKNFKQTQEHRKNHINWSINQLNFSDIKQINLEKVSNIFYKHKTSKVLARWTNTIIQEKILRLAEESGVQVNLQNAQYRSQRCCECGMVRQSNRKGKLYKCKNCGNEIDSDLNSAKNHEQSLPKLPYVLRSLKLNIKGFFWKEEGIFNSDGEELEFLAPEKEHKNLLA